MDVLHHLKMLPFMSSSYLTAIVFINCFLHITPNLVPSQIPRTVTQFSISDGSPLQHIAVHETTGDVFIGAHNMVYKLDADLNVQSQQNWLTAGIQTTPCPPENENCNMDDSTEINDNKILAIDYDNDLLLSCGSSHFGTCVLHSLESVSDIEGRIMSNLANDSIAVGETVVAFFGDFQPDGVRTPSSLYVASTYEDNPPSSSIIQHAVATKKPSRSENGQWEMKLGYEDNVYGRLSYIDLRNDEVKRDFKIKYIDGFSIPGEPGFNYFLTVQKDDVDQQDYKSKLVRICNEDKGYVSYTELTLKCKSPTGENYPLLQAAYVGNAGNNLINTMKGVKTTDDILFAVFAQNYNANSLEPAIGSALCAFPISKLNRNIKKGLQECFYGDATRGLEHMERVEDVSDCIDLSWRVITDNFCGTSILHPIDTHEMFTATDMLNGGGIGDIYTSIAVKRSDDDTIAVIGTQSGHLLKFLLEPSVEAHTGIPFKNLLLDGPVLQDMTFDPTKDHVYAMTPDTIYKFAISTCDHYIECSACILTHDPAGCGWCGSGCALRDECLEEGGSFVDEFCPPVIYKVSPPSAPLNSPVDVTLIGDNLGTGLGQGIHEFTVAGKPCIIQPANSDNKRIVCTVNPVSTPVNGPVVAHVEASSFDPIYEVNGTYSDFTFSFVDSSIESIQPAFGQLAGGTNITILGVGLNSGNNLAVAIAGLPCHIQRSNSTALICTTTASSKVASGKVTLSIDGKTYVSQQDFTYMKPPSVKGFSPSSSILSGGRQLVVNGAHLNVVEEPKIVVTIQKNDQTYNIEESCRQADSPGDIMTCASPNIAAEGLMASANEPITASVSFILEGWFETPIVIGQEMLYYPDPSFSQFPPGMTITEGSTLKLEGSNLDLASNANEITVMIRDEACVVTKLTQTNLVCKVPSLDSTSDEDDIGVQVTVTVGNRQYELGLIQSLPSTMSQTVILPVAVTLAFLLVTLLIIGLLIWIVLKKRRKPATVIDLTDEGMVAYHRTISVTGSHHSTTQYSGEARVVPPMSSNNTYLRNPSTNSAVTTAAAAFTSDESKPLLEQISNELAAQVGEILINESTLKLGDTIGQGHFGCVYEGRYIKDGEELHVAVKSLLHGATTDVANFLREGIMMKDFKHKHVLQLIGVCIKDDQIPLVVLPFMKFGDLLSHLRNPQNDLTARQLLEFSRDIADGMAYLSDLKFIHRDLAARNCMLDAESCVKVADFGLSRDLYERDYYSAKDKTAKLPVKWMALESLERNIYNTKTDVWAFGILMWELMTRGITPYPSVDNYDLAIFLQRGRRLHQPPLCPDNVYEIMSSCWLVSPIDRPSFSQLTRQLDEILINADRDTATNFDDIYINLPRGLTHL